MRVLVIEDEEKMADMLKRGLEEEGMEVTLAYDGDQGLAAGKSAGYDLIILDIGLPGRDGLEVAAELRASGVNTPLLMLTAHDATDMKVRGLDSGADDYLTKPFAFAELLARLRALQRRLKTDDTTRLQISDLILNLITRRVTRAGIEVQLTNKEFALLEYFMRHPDEILSRETLSEKVWDETFDTLTNVIDVYINYLRNKIDRNFEPKLIHTVRGVGYTFKTPSNESRLMTETRA
ncbi:MAG: response regulator transcription factor [Acidobacteria bacterium]|nr:response regulator transcription factor [Acidobacteriota bacterium]MCW5969962.1 response regulator transcription factor [Blastocatellales bacterium]